MYVNQFHTWWPAIFGEYGDFGEFLSNHQIYVNQFRTCMVASHVGKSGEYGDFGHYVLFFAIFVVACISGHISLSVRCPK